jgi:hypothetical protein
VVLSTLNREVQIYALVDPRTDSVRYIGKSTDSERRRRDHLSSGQLKFRSKKNSWIKNLQSEGLEPRLRILRRVPATQGNAAEIEMIAIYKMVMGDELTNGTDGGDGGAMPPEVAKAAGLKRRGRTHSDEEKAKRSVSQKKAFASREFRAQRSQIARDLDLKPPVLRGETNNSARFTEDDIVAMREAVANGEDRRSLAERYGTSVAQISYVVTGKTWAHVGGPIQPVKAKQRLSAEDVKEIRQQAAAGVSQASLAVRFGVDRSHVNKIVRGRSRSSNVDE